MGRKKKEIVRVDNSILGYNYSSFSVNEFRLWIALLSQVCDKGNELVEIDFSDFTELTGIANSKPKYIANVFFNMTSKIQALTEIRINDGFGQRWLFGDNDVDPLKKKIYVSVNPEYVKYVSDLLGNYTKFELKDFKPLKTRAAQEIYLQFKKDVFKNDGVVWISIEDLKGRLGIEKYRTNNVTERIVKPAIDELNLQSSFDERIAYRAVKSGREVVGYELAYESNAIFCKEIDKSQEAPCNDGWDDSEDEPW